MFLFEPQSSLVRIVNPAAIREPFSASSRGPQTLDPYEIVEILECRRATSAGVDFALVILRLARQSPIARLVLTK